MKWHNRRQSTNVIDLRNVTTATFKWVGEENALIIKEDILIYPDGAVVIPDSVVSKSFVSVAMIYEISITSSLFGSEETMTQGHRTGIMNMLKKFNSAGKIVQVNSEDGEVSEFVSSTLRNIKG